MHPRLSYLSSKSSHSAFYRRRSVFGKLHKHVIRDIENLLSNLPAERQSNFGQTFVTRANPKNPQVKIQSKAYRMTRDGFTLLVMGWTGEKALQFKLAWLDAFNKWKKNSEPKIRFKLFLSPLHLESLSRQLSMRLPCSMDNFNASN